MCSHCHLVLFFLPFCDNNSGFIDLGAGLAVGISGLAAGFAIGIVGDSGVRGTAQQPRVSVVLNLVDKEREEVFLSHISEFGSLNATSLTRAFFLKNIRDSYVCKISYQSHELILDKIN